jgi:hypothetical protein
MMHYDYQPLILIGAARSGTKLLRDLIAEHPDVDKVPYDVSYIWRIGNEAVTHDELSAELLTPQIRQRILRRLGAFSSGATFLIEKTVENCVRVPYVQAVFPNARYIHLIRDGRDVVESVYREWTRPPDWGYILKKVRTYPLIDAFDYAMSYAGSTLRKVIAQDRTQLSNPWGTRYRGIHEDLVTKDLLEVCTIQWARSVSESLAALERLPTERVLTIRYEDFVQNPGDYLRQVAQFAGFDPSPYSRLPALENVSQENIGKGFRCLTTQQQNLVLSHLQDTLELLGYIHYAN